MKKKGVEKSDGRPRACCVCACSPLLRLLPLTDTLGRSASRTRPEGLALMRDTAAARAGPPVASAAAATRSARRGSTAAPREATTASAPRWSGVSGMWVG
jgi:hypothetical protein